MDRQRYSRTRKNLLVPHSLALGAATIHSRCHAQLCKRPWRPPWSLVKCARRANYEVRCKVLSMTDASRPNTPRGSGHLFAWLLTYKHHPTLCRNCPNVSQRVILLRSLARPVAQELGEDRITRGDIVTRNGRLAKMEEGVSSVHTRKGRTGNQTILVCGVTRDGLRIYTCNPPITHCNRCVLFLTTLWNAKTLAFQRS